jgi:hypothetical protein
MRRGPGWILALGMAATAVHAQATIQVTALGEVEHPGGIVFEGKPRLADVVKAAQVKRDAYVLGAAWLRPSLQPAQKRLKAGLTYQLGLIDHNAMAKGKEPLANLARRNRDWINAMPVTGRRVVQTLEPHALQVSAPDNLPIRDGDQLVYPARPSSVTVVGAVEQICDLPHASIQDARVYLAQCVPSHYADTDNVFVIEPDGKVVEQGVALWNRSPPMPVAPGTVLYVPFGRRATLHVVDGAFDRDMAAFIATQVLASSGMKP